MQDRVSEMLCEEIGRIRRRISEIQHEAKRHSDDDDKVSAAKIELAALHTRLSELRENEKKYVV